VRFWPNGKERKKPVSEDSDIELDVERMKFESERKSEKRAYIIAVTLIILFIIFLSSVVYFAGENKTSHLSAYSNRWNDISKFRDHVLDIKDKNGEELYETSAILSSATILRQIPDPENHLYIAIGIEKKYSSDQVKAIFDFVNKGGYVIIADDYGYGNSVSNVVLETQESFNVGFVGKPLWDENYMKNPRFIKINVNRDESKLDFEGVILLNDPTALESHKTQENWYGRTIVSTSPKGWIDIDGDGRHSPYIEGEEMGKKPIIQEVSVGDGKAVFISDPSIFINDMWNRENNSGFAEALVKYLLPPNVNLRNVRNGSVKTIIFDESLHIQENVFSNARQTFFQGLVIFTTDTQLAILLGILMLLFLGVIIIIVENPPDLKHKFNIDYYVLNNLIDTEITSNDCDRIRYIFLEKLRISHGLTIEDFKELSYDELEDLIGDPELVEFALDWKRKYYGQELENILLKIRDFE
jgi:hypothetical protein